MDEKGTLFSFFNCKIGQLRFGDKNTNHLRKAIVYGNSFKLRHGLPLNGRSLSMDPWTHGPMVDGVYTSFAATLFEIPNAAALDHNCSFPT